MKEYQNIVKYVLDNGTRKENRTGVDTISSFGYNYSIDLRNGFPLLTTKRISWKNIVIENLWFLSGSYSSEFLERHKCLFWRPWYDESGNVMSGYGVKWRKFPSVEKMPTINKHIVTHNDQIQFIINEIKKNPNSRRLVVSAWEPHHAQTTKLPPCHLLFIFNVQNDAQGNPLLCLHLTQRSCDIALGVPYNIAGYAFILELMSRFTGIKAGYFNHTLVDAHIYTSKPDGSMADYDHIPGLKEQISRTPRQLPRLEIADDIKTLDDVMKLVDDNIDTSSILDKFKLIDYNPYEEIRFKVAV